jgi:dihydropteroate synthase|tara:strand:+ start:9463 stop:10305 length:843 start_codon:yes stop_codon:yes gene_type:complete
MKSILKTDYLSIKSNFNLNGKLFSFNKPLIMGIINMTPDSFFDGGKYNSNEKALKKIEYMIKNGASIIDIGGCSTRPGSDSISISNEWNRIKDVIKDSIKIFPNIIISVDTFRAEIAKRALDEGASIINDVSGGSYDSNMYKIISKYKAPYVLMHLRGTPKTMNLKSNYKNLMAELMLFFSKKIEILNEFGINDIILDPGFGFAKDYNQNYDILKNLSLLNKFNLPILVGLSRKSFVKKKFGSSDRNSLNGTIKLNKIAVDNGAHILRVHDVKENALILN